MKQVALMLFLLLKHDCLSQNEQCTAKEECSEPLSDKYTKAPNKYTAAINDALSSYRPCLAQNCSCFFDVIERDLQRFKDGITKKMMESIRSYGTFYQIIDHKLYREKECLFPARCSGVEHFIKPILNKLGNIEMVINCRDWPQIGHNHMHHGPVLSFSKTTDYLDVMYPTWGFWEGGPAIKLYPTGLGRWDKHRLSVWEASKKWPWDTKLAKAFFRGSRTSDERDSLVLLSREQPDLVDAQYTKNQAWKTTADTLSAEPAKEVSLEDHCQYKYLFNFRGVAASFRFKHLFICKSLVFHVGNEWKEFFYDALKPWVHYVPLASYPSQDDIREILQFFTQHDDLARAIAERGYEFIQKQLKMKDVECYWEKLLLEYAKLIRYDVVKENNLIQV